MAFLCWAALFGGILTSLLLGVQTFGSMPTSDTRSTVILSDLSERHWLLDAVII